LDLDADVLITEQAPITSLVQRFGRANRHATAEQNRPAQIHVYPPPKLSPYTEQDFKGVAEFLDTVAGKTSQVYLAASLAKYSPRERSASQESAFVKSSYWAVAEDFRATDDYSRSAILNKDINIVKERIEEKKPIDGFILPIPKRYGIRHTVERDLGWLPKYLEIADHNLYSTERGFGE
jgi:CRISPR-associated endonuclease/helicase Cas3